MTTAAAIQATSVRSLPSATGNQRVNVVKNAVRIRSKSFAVTTSDGRRIAVAASRSTKQEAISNSKSDDPDVSFTSQEDVSFLLKLGGGSFAGAAAIKYGSILVPEITRPNIIQALIMISTPVIVAVLILINQSRVER